MKEQILCKNYKLKPKSDMARRFFTVDTCKHLKEVKGMHLTPEWIPTKECPFFMICKFFEQKD